MLKALMTGTALLCLYLLTPLAWAQAEDDSDEDGEEYAIEQRIQWFYGSRGLDKVDRPDLKRKAATDQVQQMRAEEAQFAQSAVWTAIGPSPMNMLSWTMGRVAGRISCLALHPSDTNTLYLGTAGGGLWKTTTGGTSWTALSNDLPSQSIGSLYVDPTNPQIVWVGTGEQNSSCLGYFGTGLYKSTDGGSSFVAKNGSGGSALNLSFVSAICAHPSQNQVILAAGQGYCNNGTQQTGGIYRTNDGGTTWTKVLTGYGADLISDPNNSSVFYASMGRWADAANGIYKSTDAGQTWTQLKSGIDYGTAVTRIRLAMAPSNSNTLYAYTSESKIFKTTNGGSSWTLTGSSACEGQCTYNLCFAVSPADPATLLIGSIRFARSTNSGSTLSYLTSSWGSSQKVHQDTHVLVYDPSNANRFWVGSDGGLWRTDNGGTSFTNLNANLNITQLYDIAVAPSDPTRVFGGAQDNSSLGTDNSTIWDVNLVSGDGFMNLVDPRNANNVFQTSYPGSLPALYRSTSGGSPNSFSSLSMTGVSSGNFPWVTPLAISADSANATTYLFVGSNKVFKSTNNGTNWSSTSSSALTSSGSLSVIEAVPDSTRMMVYAGSANGGIYRSNDVSVASPSWSTVTGNYPGGNVTDIAADRANPLRVFVTRGAFGASKLYRSTTGGTTWSAVGAGLPDVPANSVVIDSDDANRIFVGTDVGVFESLDGGDTFGTLMLSFPLGTVVTDLELTRTPHVLSAATYGRGAWQIDLTTSTGNLPPTANFSFTTSGLSANFTDSSTDSDGTIASWAWTFGDGGSSTLKNPSHSYAAGGTYTVGLTVTDNGGLTASTSKSVTVSSGPTPIGLGTPKTGIGGAAGTWTEFYVDLPAAAVTPQLTITTSGGSGDADLYTRFGQPPSSSVYDCKSEGATNAESCVHDYPSSGRWYIGIYHYATTSGITLLANFTASNCAPFSTSYPNLSGAKSSWQHFSFNVATCATLLTVKSTGGSGDADLYVRAGAQPTTTSYNCRPYTAGNNETCTLNTPVSGLWYASLRGYSAYAGVTLTISYE